MNPRAWWAPLVPALCLGAGVLAGLGWPAPAAGQDWTDPVEWVSPFGGSFHWNANWDSGQVPDCSNDAVFGVTGADPYEVYLNGDAGTNGLIVTRGNDVTLDLCGHGYTLGSCTGGGGVIAVGDPSAGDGTLTVEGGILWGGELRVGGSGFGGQLSLTAGGEVWATQAGLYGTTTVTGTGSELALTSPDGWGRLTIEGGGSLTVSAGGQVAAGPEVDVFDTLTVTGAGSALGLNMSPDDWAVVRIRAGACLQVLDGGRIDSPDAIRTHGPVAVTGQGSTLSAQRWLRIYGGGSLAVTDGGQALAGWAECGGTVVVEGDGSLLECRENLSTDGAASLTVRNHGRVSAGDMDLSGPVAVDGDGALLECSGYGRADDLQVTNGARVSSFSFETGGAVTVDGPGSALTCQSNINVWSGASLTVSNGGDCSAGAVHVSGEMVVDGPSSTCTVSHVGVEGGGDLTIRNGGRFWTEDGWCQQGTVTVTGQGSTLWAGDLDANDGCLTVTDGGTVNVTDELSGWCQQVTVTGQGSTLSAGELDAEDGRLTVTDGGTVNVTDDLVLSDAFIAAGGTVNVGGDVYTDCDEITVGNGGALSVGGDLEVDEGQFTLGQGGTLNVGGMALVDWGTLAVASGSSFHSARLELWEGQVTFDDMTLDCGPVMMYTGRIVGAGAVPFDIQGDWASGITATGDLELGDGGSLGGYSMAGQLTVGAHRVTLHAAPQANLGRLTTIDGGVLAADYGVFLGGGCCLAGHGQVQGAVVAAMGSVIMLTGDLTMGSDLYYSGIELAGKTYIDPGQTLTLLDADEALLGGSVKIAAGVLEAPNGLLMVQGAILYGYGVVTADTETHGKVIGVGPEPADALEFTGTVTGSGEFVGNVIFSGTYSPGSSPAEVFLENVTFADTATLVIELGGPDAGSGYDCLRVSGDAALDGQLQVQLVGNFSTCPGDSFGVIASGRRIGHFAGVCGHDLGGLFLGSDYTETALTLTTTYGGDATLDFRVDYVDLGVVASNYDRSGVTWEQGDFTGDGRVDYRDLGILATYYGLGAGGTAPVPEPGMLSLLGVLALSLPKRRGPAPLRRSR